ncbi:MAG TPA: cytochrome c [Steroidobacteraceae bacterium]|nr:cytochrome c [Steroidobacteraceae bacterium]
MRKLWAIAGGSTLVYVVLALMMGVFPGLELSKTAAGPGVRPLTPLEVEGRAVYAANGCGYCHTQQIRPLQEDEVFGRPSAPGDFAYQTPELLGSERTGPDLTDVGTRRGSDVWQYMHLYNPRSVVPESIMPSFSWMFRVVDRASAGVTPVPIPAGFAPAHGIVVPTPKARALVAYLLSLKQPPLASPASASGEGSAAASSEAAAAAPSASIALPAVVPAQSAGKAGAQPAPSSSAQIAHGEAVFTANCAACHQASGEGLPGAFPPLKGNAAVNDADPTLHIHTVLFGAHGLTIGGVSYASQMPPFGPQLSDQDVADVVDYERSAWGNHAPPVSAAAVARIRSQGH